MTHADKVLFTSRAHYMFHECKRFFNGETSAEARSQYPQQPHMVDIVQVDIPGPPAENVNPKQDADLESLGSDQENEPDPAPKGADLKVFRNTTTNRDDWLHRGMALLDLDWHCYVRHVERVRVPTNIANLPDTVRYFPFEKHYVLSAKYGQALRRNPMVVPRTIGPQCPQHSVDEGEPNALYKATLFTPLCCMGVGHQGCPRFDRFEFLTICQLRSINSIDDAYTCTCVHRKIYIYILIYIRTSLSTCIYIYICIHMHSI